MSDPSDGGFEDERALVARELQRIRERVREQSAGEPTRLPDAREPRAPQAPAGGPDPERLAAPAAPDGVPVNRSWDLRAVRPGGLRGLLARLLRFLIEPYLEAQTTHNSHQVQLDNQILDYVAARFDHTHAHYDRVLGLHGRHMQEIDERHLILQEELVAHVHDLVRRTDLVLAEAERGRMSLTFQLRELRSRLAQLEGRLRDA